MNNGFVILAQDIDESDIYYNCAETLARNIHHIMPDAKVSLVSNNKNINATIWDKVIPLPYGDLAPESDWKLINDWQVYEASPYEYTIKLEADLYIPRNIDYWWDVLKHRDIVICSTIRNFKSEVSDVRVYRKFVDDNKLPDAYNAITYFKKSETAAQFFNIVRNIFEHWEEYKSILRCDSKEQATTDWVYAIACHIMGVEKTMLPAFKEFSMVHMKQFINELNTEDWTDSLIYECFKDQLRINTFPQIYPFHYHVKSFSNKIRKIYG